MNAVEIEDDDYDEFVGDDEWEDEKAIQDIMDEYPGWFLMKITNYTSTKLSEILEWCNSYCTQSWEKVGWYSGCAYTVGVVLENHVDAVLFRLTWSD